MNWFEHFKTATQGGWLARALLAATALVLAQPDLRAQGNSGDTLHVVVTPLPENFDVIGTNSTHEARILALVHERLLVWNPQTQSIEPGVAEVPKSDDKKSWKLLLRPAKTPDGQQVTAEDVIFSLEKITSKEFCPENYTQFSNAGKPIKAEAADGGRAVIIRLDTPSEDLPRILTGVPVLPAAAFKTITPKGDDWRKALDQSAPATKNNKFLRGFGPYFVVEGDNDKILLDANPNYHGKAGDGTVLPKVKHIVLRLFPNPQAAKEQFKTNRDFKYMLVDPTDVVEFPQPDYAVDKRGLQDVTVFLWFNQNEETQATSPPLILPGKFKLMSDENFRRVISGLLDRDALVAEVFQGEGAPAYGPYSSQAQGFNPDLKKDAPPVLTTDQAITALREAGVKVETTRSLSVVRLVLLAAGVVALGVVGWRRAAARRDKRALAALPWGVAAAALITGAFLVPGVLRTDPKPGAYYEEDGKLVPLTFTLITPVERSVQMKASEWVKDRLAAVGIKVEVKPMTFKEVVRRLDGKPNRDYEMALMRLESPPESDVFNRFNSKGGMSFHNRRRGDPKERVEPWQVELDDITVRFPAEPDPAKRKAMLARIQQLHAKHVPVFYLAIPKQILVTRTDSKLVGMATNSLVFEPVLDRPFVENLQVVPQK
jgi:ABC-type transport system substrate-binding protein